MLIVRLLARLMLILKLILVLRIKLRLRVEVRVQQFNYMSLRKINGSVMFIRNHGKLKLTLFFYWIFNFILQVLRMEHARSLSKNWDEKYFTLRAVTTSGNSCSEKFLKRVGRQQ